MAITRSWKVRRKRRPPEDFSLCPWNPKQLDQVQPLMIPFSAMNINYETNCERQEWKHSRRMWTLWGPHKASEALTR